ncbi:MAG: hypothetical protein HY287_05845 [Planctomycetes bacterium]|nr:hypothetical protein [Planctomycetota bacterium]MBI3833834.1 hypothetical protein [Planctomycetota bacterium]
MPLTDTSDGIAIAAKNKTLTKSIYIENPTSTDELPLGYVPDASTIVAVRAVTNTGTVDFNIEKRNKFSPGSAGTNIWSADKQANSTGLEQATFDSAAISADQWLHYSASATIGTPAKLWISVEYTID